MAEKSSGGNKPKGWHSRRHSTPEAHDSAREEYARRKKEKVASAKQRQEDAETRTPTEQLDRLDARLGVGKGAKRERIRLLAMLVKKEEE